MTYKEKLDQIRDGIFHCSFELCIDCPYSKFEVCSKVLLWDVDALLTRIELLEDPQKLNQQIDEEAVI